MTKILAAVVNPTLPTSFEGLGEITERSIAAVKDHAAFSGTSYDDCTPIAFFPEYWVSRVDSEYDFEDRRDISVLFESRRPVPKASEEMEMMRDIARRHNFYISSGWIEQASSGNYLAALLMGPDGEILARQRKHNPVSEIAGVPLETPSWNLKKGRGTNVYGGDDFTLGWLICNDINNPKLAERLYEKEVEIVHHPKGFDFNEFGSIGKSWGEVERTRAKDMEAYLVSDTNKLGKGIGESVPGQIVDYHGIQLISLEGNVVKYAVLDLDNLRRYRMDPRSNPSEFSAPRVR